MARKILQPFAAAAWELVDRQHGVIARWQLLALGVSSDAIAHRLATGRLHRVWRGVYAVGRPQLAREGIWMAAVLACGPCAALSHFSAGALYRVAREQLSRIHVCVPAHVNRSQPGIVVHRRTNLLVCEHQGIPVTTPLLTLIDLAACVGRERLEAASTRPTSSA